MELEIEAKTGVPAGARSSERLKVPSLRCDLPNTGMCGSIPRSCTSQARFSAEP